MTIYLTREIESCLKKLKKKNPQLIERVSKQLSIFASDQFHPSLRTHKLSGALNNLWSISITKSIRMTCRIDNNTAVFTNLGTHDQVYKR